MRRKIIKQGHNTLTVTLPSSWVKQLNLKAVDEVHVAERDHGLFLSAEREDDSRKAVIDITHLDIPTIWKYFMAVYREGYDEVMVQFDPGRMYKSPYKFFISHSFDMRYEPNKKHKTPVETIQGITNRFIGFEIVEHHKDSCVIKDMSMVSSKEFDSSLRRVFFANSADVRRDC